MRFVINVRRIITYHSKDILSEPSKSIAQHTFDKVREDSAQDRCSERVIAQLNQQHHRWRRNSKRVSLSLSLSLSRRGTRKSRDEVKKTFDL